MSDKKETPLYILLGISDERVKELANIVKEAGLQPSHGDTLKTVSRLLQIK